MRLWGKVFILEWPKEKDLLNIRCQVVELLVSLHSSQRTHSILRSWTVHLLEIILTVNKVLAVLLRHHTPNSLLLGRTLFTRIMATKLINLNLICHSNLRNQSKGQRKDYRISNKILRKIPNLSKIHSEDLTALSHLSEFLASRIASLLICTPITTII